MKRAIILSLLGALGLGCSATPAPRAPARSEKVAIVLPSSEEPPPGTMDVDWEPKAPPPPRQIVPRRLDAKPQLVSPTTSSHGRLFALPTRASASKD